jgi:hypothetical protein
MDNVLILVPEITKGMKSLGSKALLTIKNSKSVLEYQIEQIRKFHKKTKIFIGTGFESAKIKKFFDKYSNVYFVENTEYENTNQARLLSSFVNTIDVNNLLVISNGILFRNNPFLSDKEHSKIFVLDKPKINFTIGCCESINVNYLFYDLPIPWAECVFFNKTSIKEIRTLSQTHNIDQLYLFEIINNLITDYGVNFLQHTIKKQNIMKIHTLKDISKAKLFI